MSITMIRRPDPVICDPDNSVLTFQECLEREGSRHIGELFAKKITVAVPHELAKQYPAGMKTMDDRPLWTYRLVRGKVRNLQPKATISHL